MKDCRHTELIDFEKQHSGEAYLVALDVLVRVGVDGFTTRPSFTWRGVGALVHRTTARLRHEHEFEP